MLSLSNKGHSFLPRGSEILDAFMIVASHRQSSDFIYFFKKIQAVCQEIHFTYILPGNTIQSLPAAKLPFLQSR